MNDSDDGNVGASFNLADYYLPDLQWQLRVDAGRVYEMREVHGSRLSPLHGVAHYVFLKGERRLIGFFSKHRHATIDAPNYADSLFVFIDDVVFGNDGANPKFRFAKHGTRRTLEAWSDRIPKITLEYSTPLLLDFLSRLFMDPLRFKSRDFVGELVSVVKSARPTWLTG